MSVKSVLGVNKRLTMDETGNLGVVSCKKSHIESLTEQYTELIKRLRKHSSDEVHLLAQRETNEDIVINRMCAVRIGLMSDFRPPRVFHIQGVADGHQGKEAAELVKKQWESIFKSALLDVSRDAPDEKTVNDRMDFFVQEALKKTNIQLQEEIVELAGRSGTTLVLTVWLVDDAHIEDTTLQGWSLVVGDSQFAVSSARDGTILHCVVEQNDLATGVCEKFAEPQMALSFPQAITGEVLSRTGEKLPVGRPLTHDDVEKLSLSMKGDETGCGMREVVMLNQSKISNPGGITKLPSGYYFDGLQCTRSLETNDYLRIATGIIYTIKIPAKQFREAGGVCCICFCDGFCDNGALTPRTDHTRVCGYQISVGNVGW